MPVEQFANTAQSTLSAGMLIGDTSLTVTSAATFPTTGQFRVRIDNEIILVGAVSGATFSSLTRAAEGTAAAAHPIGDAITHVLTAAALQNVVSNAFANVVAAPYNADPTGTNDATTAIQTALNTARHVWIPYGTYLVTGLVIGSNTTLTIHPHATIVRTATATGIGNATIRNSDPTNSSGGNTNITVEGGIWTAQTSAATGPHLGFSTVTGLRLRKFRCTSVYGDWNVPLLNCNQFSVTEFEIDDGFGLTLNDGVHLVGCQDGAIGDGTIHTGDDCIALSVGTYGSLGVVSNSIARIAISNIATRPSKSSNIKLFVTPTATTQTITKVVVSNITGFHDGASASGISININDSLQQNLISDIQFNNVTVDATNGSGQCITATYANKLTFNSVRILNPGSSALFDNCNSVHLTNCAINNIRGAAQSGMVFTECIGVKIDQCSIDTPTSHGIVFGKASTTVTGAQVVGAGANLVVGSTSGWSTTGSILTAGSVLYAYSAVVDATHVTLVAGGTFSNGQVIAANPVQRAVVSATTVSNATNRHTQLNSAIDVIVSGCHAPGCAGGITEAAPSDASTFYQNDFGAATTTGVVTNGPATVSFENRAPTGLWSQSTIRSAVSLLGVATAPTPAAGDNSTNVATTAFVAALSGAVGGFPKFVRRTVNSGNMTANIVLTNDDTLLWSVGASDVWFVEAFLLVSAANTTMDITMGWSVPTGGVMTWGAAANAANALAGYGTFAAATTPAVMKTAAQAMAVGTTAGTTGTGLAGVYVGDGVHAGTVNFQWAQATSDAGALALLANSFLMLVRLA